MYRRLCQLVSIDELVPEMQRSDLGVPAVIGKLLCSGDEASCVWLVRIQPESDLLQVFPSASFFAATKRNRRS